MKKRRKKLAVHSRPRKYRKPLPARDKQGRFVKRRTVAPRRPVPVKRKRPAQPLHKPRKRRAKPAPPPPPPRPRKRPKRRPKPAPPVKRKRPKRRPAPPPPVKRKPRKRPKPVPVKRKPRKPRPKPPRKPRKRRAKPAPPPPPPPAPRPTKRLREPGEVPVDRIGLSDVTWKTGAHLELEKDRFKNFSHMNRQEPINVMDVFDGAIKGHVEKSGFAQDEVTLYDHGVLMRAPEGTIGEALLETIREVLRGTGASVTVVEEGPNQDAALIHFGDSKVAMSVEGVRASLESFREAIEKIHREFVDYYDDYPDWAFFWDTDEELY